MQIVNINSDVEEDGHEHSGWSFRNLKLDLNVGAVFLHYLGDMFSSALVLASGFLIQHFDGEWTKYVDPVTSLLIVVLIFWSTYPLVKRACMILMQSTPTDIPLRSIRSRIMQVKDVMNVHDFHIWQLVDELRICSMHVTIQSGASFKTVVETIRNILHEYGIHSSAIQPEFADPTDLVPAVCQENCIEECEADWCCKSISDVDVSDPNQIQIQTQTQIRSQSSGHNHSHNHSESQSLV